MGSGSEEGRIVAESCKSDIENRCNDGGICYDDS